MSSLRGRPSGWTMSAVVPDASALAARFSVVRATTLALAAPLSAEDCALQSMPDASPVKWHLAHTTWFFETFVLERYARGYRPFDPRFRVLFNSYYNAVGDRHPRPERGLLSRPSLDDVRAYRRARRRAHARCLFAQAADDPRARRPDRTRHPPRAAAPGTDPDRHQAPAVAAIRSNPCTGGAGRARRRGRTRAAWLPYAGGLVEIGQRGAASPSTTRCRAIASSSRRSSSRRIR